MLPQLPSSSPRPARPARARPALLRYGAAVAATGAALGLSLALRAWMAPNIFLLFFAAVVAVAWYAGRTPSLVVALAAVPLVDWFFLRHVDGWAPSAADVVRLAAFVALSLVVGTMRERLDAARLRAEDDARRMEEQAVELEAQAEELARHADLSDRLNVELRAAQEQLRASMEQQLAEAQQVARMGSWEWERETDQVTWSTEAFRIFGREPGGALDSGVLREVVHPDDREAVQEAVRSSLARDGRFAVDHRILRPDGGEGLVHLQGRVMTDEAGRPVRVVGTVQDVTSQREAEATALRLAAETSARAEAEEGRLRLEALLEALGDGFFAVDGAGRVLAVNGAAAALAGRPREGLVGTPVAAALPVPAGAGTEGGAVLARVAAARVPGTWEEDTPGGDRRLEVRAYPWDGGMAVFCHDVTERRRAERDAARLAAIVAGSEDAIIGKDLDGTIRSWNGGAERLYGYTAEEIVGRPVATLAPADRADEIPALLARLGRGERVAPFETVRRRKDGTFVDVLLSVSPIRAPSGALAGAATIARDITDRKEAETRLREGEARFRRLIETAREGIWLLDGAGRTSYANARLAEMLGTDPDAMLGRPLDDFLDAPSREAMARLRAGGGDGTPRQQDLRFVRADGGEMWGQVSLGALGGDGVLAMVSDVTERRRAEDRLRFLAEASRILSSSLDYRATLTSITRLAVPFLGDFSGLVLATDDGIAPVAVAAVDGETERRLWGVFESYRAGAGEGSPTLQALARGRPVVAGETTPEAVAARLRDPDAARRVEEMGVRAHLSVPLLADDRVIGALAVGVTTSGRHYGADDLALAEELARRAATAVENARLHEAEQAARTAAERAADRVARILRVTAALSEARTVDGVAEAAAREGAAAVGARAAWVARTAPEGDALEILHQTGYPAEAMEAFRRMPLDRPLPVMDALRTGEVVTLESPAERDARYPGVSLDPPTGDAAWAAVPFLVEGRAVGAMGLSFAAPRAFDADTLDFLLALARQTALALERSRLFEAERAARAEAEAANRAKFEFLTTMSHELRTPLNAIAGYVELLDLGIRGPVTEAQREDLARIRRSQKHLLGLINDVLNFARIETGHVHFDVADVPLDAALSELETLVSPQLQAKSLAYVYRPADPAATVRADRDKFQQIVLNLLSNAVKFTPAGGRIEMDCGEADGRTAVHVRDTGMGIPDDKLATIFEPFVQVNAGYTRTSEGTGLGLAISRDLARAMGGDLTVASREGEGSVFTLVLPAGAAAA